MTRLPGRKAVDEWRERSESVKFLPVTQFLNDRHLDELSYKITEDFRRDSVQDLWKPCHRHRTLFIERSSWETSCE